jgi:hypothetical protein
MVTPVRRSLRPANRSGAIPKGALSQHCEVDSGHVLDDRSDLRSYLAQLMRVLSANLWFRCGFSATLWFKDAWRTDAQGLLEPKIWPTYG